MSPEHHFPDADFEENAGAMPENQPTPDTMSTKKMKRKTDTAAPQDGGMGDEEFAEFLTCVIAKKFQSFGSGSGSSGGNPIAEACKDLPPEFYAGVSIRSVVDEVLRLNALRADIERHARESAQFEELLAGGDE